MMDKMLNRILGVLGVMFFGALGLFLWIIYKQNV